MPTPDRTHHNLNRLRAVFAVSAIALLGVTVWALVADHRREWRQYQASDDRGIEQIVLPELTVDYHFCQVGRTDRCVTCHQNIDVPQTDYLWLRRPYSHPRLDLYVGADSPHPMAEFGCTICHEGQGRATEFRFASHTPNDMNQRRAWRERHDWFRDVDWDYPMLARRFAESRCLQCHPDVTDLEPSPRWPDPPAPKLMAGYHLVRQLGCFGCHEIEGVEFRGEPVGPSLRDVGSRLARPFLADWIARPARFRPDTRMPRLFGHEAHLDAVARQKARRLEAVEVDALAQWLRDACQPVAVPPSATDSTSPSAAGSASVHKDASVERGRRLLLTRGCLACHKHDDYPRATGTQGPNLSRLGSKYATARAAAWLADWLRDPARQSPRTRMPNPLLARDAAAANDPVADLTAFLLASAEWNPSPPSALQEADLDELVQAHLAARHGPDEARRIVEQGLSDREFAATPGDERELARPITRRKKLHYVARRTIAKRGCFGCHDIPGFELARPIGPALSDWGRKDESLLAFGRVERLLAADGTADRAATDHDVGFYLDAVRGRRREGFLWQKLREPRSFDYQKMAGRGFNEWLKMGRFSLDDARREAIATFVLGLIARPPASKYVYRPDAATRAIVEGRKVLDRHACVECHVLEMDRWRLAYESDEFDAPPPIDQFDFMRPRIARERLDASARPGPDGRARSEIVGMPRRTDDGQVAALEGDKEDAQGEPLPVRAFTLWQPAAIAGRVWPAGGPEVLLYDDQIIRRYPAWGGAALELLYPAALAEARAAGASVVGSEVWGRLPPPLVGEGAKVWPDWLADHLLDPQPIRPGAMMRMPRYTLSLDEANRLVDFFLAHAGADRIVRRATGSSSAPVANRRDEAMRLLTDHKTFCAKCHVIGDSRPGGATATEGPDLAVAGRRLRGEYLRRWLARPQMTLPYTPMPVNFPPSGEPIGQDLLPGDSREQIDAMVDLLEQFDAYLREKTSIGDMVPKS
ncbi:MAG: cytochrome c [Pirellulales bacterium]|nr:cytochrome c [Pirellulales bacterium]